MLYQVAVVGILLFAALWLMRKWASSFTHKESSARTPPSGSWLLKQAKKACRQGDHEQALNYLYQWMDRHGNNTDGVISKWVEGLDNDELKLTYVEMMQAIYSRDNSRSPDTCRFTKQLSAAIKKADKPKLSVQWTVEMKLN